MTEKKRLAPKKTTIIAIGCLIALLAVSGVLFNYIEQNVNAQTNSQASSPTEPKLVSVNFNYVDDRTDPSAPFLHITGSVENTGTGTANKCTLHVNAISNENATAIDTSALIPQVLAGASETVDLQFPYSGPALVEYHSYLGWTD
ncbi:MAG: hypothetical protein ACQCN6_02655 [Candidatus Bathyarchaeia archaeon]|jgi:hypothetical protein